MTDEGSECNLHSWRSSRAGKICPYCAGLLARAEQAEAERDALAKRCAELSHELTVVSNTAWHERGNLKIAIECLRFIQEPMPEPYCGYCEAVVSEAQSCLAKIAAKEGE